MKLNMGCGNHKVKGFVNVDLSPVCEPDLVVDLEVMPWPWPNDSVEEVIFNHCLEHIGKDSKTFLAMFKELYRVCADDALIRIVVPHPRNDNFINDPTHVRIITPELLSLFSKKQCDYWKEKGAANTPLAHYLGIDFEVIPPTILTFEEPYHSLIRDGLMTQKEWEVALREKNNVANEYKIELRARKEAAAAGAGAASTAFLYEPDWAGSAWKNVLLSYVAAFAPGEPVGLVFPLDETVSIQTATGWITDVVVACGKDDIPDIVLVDHKEKLIETLRRYGSIQWVAQTAPGPGQLTGPFGQRFAQALEKPSAT